MAKKKTSKKDSGKDKSKKKRKRKGPTICSVVLECLDKDPDMDVPAIREVLAEHGMEKSKFSKSHLAWYKYQVRKGNLELPSGGTLPPAKRGRKPKPKDEEAGKDEKKKKKKKKKKKDAE